MPKEDINAIIIIFIDPILPLISSAANKMCQLGGAICLADLIKNLQIGNIPPDFTIKSNYGADVNLKNTCANNKYTIIMFWDPTCGHCKEVMPKVAKLYERNKSKGWKVITLASGDKKKEWYDYLAKHPEISEFTNLIRGEVLSQKYADALSSYYVIASPTIYLLDEK